MKTGYLKRLKKGASMYFCPQCGKELPKDVKVCPFCGEKEQKKLFTLLIGLYIIINILLEKILSFNNEIAGVAIYSLVIIISLYFRKDSKNPYNWFVNILLVLQGVLVFSIIIVALEHINATSIMQWLTLALLILLFIVIVLLLYKGNRR